MLYFGWATRDNGEMKKGTRNSRKEPKIGLNEFKLHTGVLIEHMDERFDAVNETLNSHTEMIGKLATDMEIVKADVASIKFDLKRKVDYDEFSRLEKRVARLEHRVHN